MNERIAIFGLGAMGFGMASNLLKSGYQVSVTVHRNAETVHHIVAMGAQLCESKLKAADSSDVIILCLPNSTDVEEVIDEIWPVLNSRHLILDTGTSSVSAVRILAGHLASKAIMFAEAPVAGGTVQAELGELGAFVGASEESFARIQPILKAFCTSINHFGPVGAGCRAKLISNHLVLGMVRLIIETFHAADVLEIDWEMFYRIICKGSGNSSALHRIIGGIVDENSHAGYVFSVKNACKDMRYIMELKQESGLESILSDSALNLFCSANERGYGERMISELLGDDIRPVLAQMMAADKISEIDETDSL